MLFGSTSMEGDPRHTLISTDLPSLDMGQQVIGQAHPKFCSDRHPKRTRCTHCGAQDRLKYSRSGRHSRSPTSPSHFGGRAAKVQIDMVHHSLFAQLADRRGQGNWITAVDLEAARMFVSTEGHHPRGLTVAMQHRCCHHHLIDIDQVWPKGAAQTSKSRISHSSHRGQHDRCCRDKIPNS